MVAKAKPKRNPSALRRARQAEERNIRNRAVKSEVKSLIKKVESAISSGNKEDAHKALKEAIKALTMAASKSVIHKNNASRGISRLTRKVNALSKAEAA